MSGTITPAGWYADPFQPSRLRYFDGSAWTDHTTAVALPPPGPVAAAPVASATPPTAYAAYSSPAYSAPTHASTAYPRQTVPASDGGLHWLVPVGRTGLSIAAGYAGIVGLLCFYTAPVALVLGLLALRELRDPALRGRGRAWFATVVGALGSVLLLVFVVADLLDVPGWS